jgi:DNA-binding CsgD family transcriptional regulator
MQKNFLNLIKLIVPYDKATFYLSKYFINDKNKSKNLLANPVSVNFDKKALEKYEEYGEQLDFTRWLFICAKKMVYKETDLLPNFIRENTKYYKTFYAPYNIHFSAGLNLSYNNIFLGIITLYRSKNNGDFSEKDLFVLTQIKNHLSYRLYKEYSNSNGSTNDPTVYFNTNYLNDKYNLTDREKEVLSLLCKGYSNQEMASQLCISIHTIKKHIRNIYSKLKINSRSELMKIFFSNDTDNDTD